MFSLLWNLVAALVLLSESLDYFYLNHFRHHYHHRRHRWCLRHRPNRDDEDHLPRRRGERDDKLVVAFAVESVVQYPTEQE